MRMGVDHAELFTFKSGMPDVVDIRCDLRSFFLCEFHSITVFVALSGFSIHPKQRFVKLGDESKKDQVSMASCLHIIRNIYQFTDYM